LGVIITNDGRIDKEIKNWIKKANQIYYEINNTVLGKKEVDPKSKIQIYKSVHIPTLYGKEILALNYQARKYNNYHRDNISKTNSRQN
jgi:hypothetical protein